MLIVTAFVAGALIVTTVTVLTLRLVQRRWKVEANTDFVAAGSAEEVRTRLTSLAAGHRGWRVRRDHPADSVVITCRTTPWTWTKIIECRVESQGPASSMVAVSCATPQLYDWGECQRTVDLVRTNLAA